MQSSPHRSSHQLVNRVKAACAPVGDWSLPIDRHRVSLRDRRGIPFFIMRRASGALGPTSALQLLEQEILSFALVFGVALLMARIEHRPVGASTVCREVAFLAGNSG